MVIDFHTHIFPEKIAAGTISHLEQAAKIKAYTDGTLGGLKHSMKRSGVDISVVLPVVTKPGQFRSINHYGAEITGKDGIISFGGMHPDSEDYKAELEEIKKLGLPGVKLHPDYQNTFIDDRKYIRIIQYGLELGLIFVIHSGLDIGIPDPIHCTPERAAVMLEKVQLDNFASPKVILAHTGGFACWDKVEKYLVGQKVILDLSYSLGFIDPSQLIRIIKQHGADKILFASDSPWSGQKETLEAFFQLGLSKEEEEKILYKNGAVLLGEQLKI